jgi:hypothetical protein
MLGGECPRFLYPDYRMVCLVLRSVRLIPRQTAPYYPVGTRVSLDALQSTGCHFGDLATQDRNMYTRLVLNSLVYKIISM